MIEKKEMRYKLISKKTWRNGDYLNSEISYETSMGTLVFTKMEKIKSPKAGLEAE